MNEFLEQGYFHFLNFKNLKNETQNSLNEFCNYYINNYKGSTEDNLESLRLFFNKFLKDNKKDSIFLCSCQNTLKINVYDSTINFLEINNSLELLNKFIKEFKNFLKEF